MAALIPAAVSLVKYETPVLIARTTDKKSSRARVKSDKDKLNSSLNQSLNASISAGGPPVPAPGRTTKLPPVEQKKANEAEDILSSILPPREFSEGGQLWIQQVSSTPATRVDVMKLQELLDVKLQQRQARETGICPVRRELYSQCFDEIIRQVTLECAERGLLLLRVRDEIRMTVAAYQTLYESSVAFGMRKALQAEQGKADMENKIIELQGEKKDLEAMVASLKAKCEDIELRGIERQKADAAKHVEEIQFLKRTNGQYKSQLDAIGAPAKK